MEYLIVKMEDGRYALVTPVAIFEEHQLKSVCEAAEGLINLKPPKKKD